MRTILTGWRADLLGAAAVMLANPVLYRFNLITHYPPDAFAYLTLARDILTEFPLYIRSWGHVDNGLILPPLYSCLIGLGQVFTSDLLSVAVWISGGCFLLAGVALYWLVKGRSGRVVAAFAVIAAQVNAGYFNFALTPLTEALFVLMVACTLLALGHAVTKRDWIPLFGLGLLCSLVFLTRQVGLLVLFFSLLWVALAELKAFHARVGILVKRLLFVVAGFAVLFAPYLAILYQQTGQSPLARRFRLGLYSVSTDDRRVWSEIDRIRANPVGDYDDAYTQRREMWRLLPDGSEMYSHVRQVGSGIDNEASPLGKANHSLWNAWQSFFSRFTENVSHLNDALGILLFCTFAATSLTTFIPLKSAPSFIQRSLLAAFAWFYVLGLSAETGLVFRYVHVVIPFVVLHIASELYLLGRAISSHDRSTHVVSASTILILVTGTALMPAHFHDVRLREKFPMDAPFLSSLREKIEPGEPVFSIEPIEAYTVDGAFRILPNDELRSVAAYGEKTGVKWILITTISKGQHSLYSRAPWLKDPRIDQRFPDLVELVSSLGENSCNLYRIRPRNSKGNTVIEARTTNRVEQPRIDGDEQEDAIP